MRKRRGWIIAAGLGLLLGSLAFISLRGSGSAEKWQVLPKDFPIISTRGSFDMSGRLLPGKARGGYSIEGQLMVFDGRSGQAPADIVIVIHGFNNSPEKARLKFGIAEEGLRNNGYEGIVAGFSWDSDRQRDPVAATGYHAGRRVAVGSAAMLANFLAHYRQDCPNCRIHLIGYSMGARLALETLLELQAHPPFSEPGLSVDSLHLVGAAVDDDEVELTARYGRAIEARCSRVYNYYSPEDNKLGVYYWPKEANRALGETGIEHADLAPGNYHDVDVTLELHSYTENGVLREGEEGDNHSGYLGNRGPDGKLLDDGVMDLVSNNMRILQR